MNTYERNYGQTIEKIKNGKRISPLKAIRLFCLECCGYQSNEVQTCLSKNECILFHYRLGKNKTGKSNLSLAKPSGETSHGVLNE